MDWRFTGNVTCGIVLLEVELNFRYRLLSTVSGMYAMVTSHEIVCGEQGMCCIQQSKVYYLSARCIFDLLELKW